MSYKMQSERKTEISVHVFFKVCIPLICKYGICGHKLTFSEEIFIIFLILTILITRVTYLVFVHRRPSSVV